MPSLITKPEYKALMALCRRAEGIGAELDSDRYANALSESSSAPISIPGLFVWSV